MSDDSTTYEDFDLYQARPLPELQSTFKTLREQCPIGRSAQNGGFWMAMTYDTVHTIARDESAFSNSRGIIIPPIDEKIGLVSFDPPEHTKYRNVLQPWLSAVNVRRFDDRVHEVSRRYLDALESPCDMVSGYALPVALEVITTVLGVPAEARPGMAAMMESLLREAGNDMSKAIEAMRAFGTYIEQALIGPRRELGPTDDPDDVVDLLVGAQVDGRGLTDAEISQLVLAVLNAGFETTYKGLSASLWYLAQDPAAWKGLRAGTIDIEVAVEELLRFITPVSVGRTAAADVTIAGADIKAGDSVLLCLHSANRDSAVFDDADSLVFDRQPNRHLTFGTGIHRCIGMHLARLELTVAISEAVAAFEEIWVPDGAELRFEGSQAAGVVSLPIEFTRSA